MSSSSPGIRRLSFGVILPLAVLLGCVAALLALGTAEPERRPVAGTDRASLLWQLPPAETQSVRSLSEVGDELQIRADGVVVPYREIALATEVAGRIIAKDPSCEAGTFVTQGQLLLRIDPTDYQLEVERLEKQQRQESQALRELDQEIVNTERLIEVSEQELELQERELARLRALPSGFASEVEIDQARRAQLQALNNKVSLQNQRQLLERRRARLEAAEQLAATMLEKARLDLARTEIRSPVDGVILRENAEVNSFTQRGATVVTIDQAGRVEVAASLRMDQLYWVLDQTSGETGTAGQIRNEQYRLPPTPVTIQYRMAGREDEVLEWEGRLERYDGIGLDPTSRTVPVTIVVDQPNRWRSTDGTPREQGSPAVLVRGMFVQVILHVRPQTPLVLVPSLGLRPGNRVWEFVADASVLEPIEGGPSQAAAAVQGKAVTAPERAGFNPDTWQAGRLEMVERVRPVTSVSLGDAPADADPATNEYWICEVPGRVLEPGDLVVVTPLVGTSGQGEAREVRVPMTRSAPAVSSTALDGRGGVGR